tara:strand:+ start:65 stop:430 length:366 start_codon:yes stop_codon:yes gene_type:complete
MIVSFSFTQSVDVDSSKIKNPSIAWKIAFIPGFGQLYNEKYIKFATLTALQVFSIKNYTTLRSQGNITKRNTWGWWVIGLYFYGILDAYVDAQLSSFPSKINKKSVNTETTQGYNLETKKK